MRAQSFVHEHKDKGAMRAELEKWVVGVPLHMQEYVRNTPDEHLYLSIVGDRCASPDGRRALHRATAWRARLDAAGGVSRHRALDAVLWSKQRVRARHHQRSSLLLQFLQHWLTGDLCAHVFGKLVCHAAAN
jgi:hypothetical protein